MEHRTLGRTGREVSVVGLGTWQLGADWGEVSEADARAVLEASAEAGRDVLRHRRRLRRRPQRADRRPVPRRPPGRRLHRRDQDGPPGRAGAGELRPRQLPRVDRPLAPQPRRRHARPGAAALPAVAPSSTTTRRTTRWTRWSTTARSRRTASASRPSTQALSAIARPHVASVQIILNAFRLKPLDEVLPAAAAGRRRDHRPGAAGLGAAVREVRRSTPRSRRTTTAPTTATAAPSTSARPSPASTTRPASRRRAEFTALGRDAAPRASPRRRRPSRGSWQQPGVSTVIPGARNAEPGRSQRGGGDGGGAPRGLPRRRPPDLRRAPARGGPPALVTGARRQQATGRRATASTSDGSTRYGVNKRRVGGVRGASGARGRRGCGPRAGTSSARLRSPRRGSAAGRRASSRRGRRGSRSRRRRRAR